jgi:glycosyltransferase 2 family protein
VFGVNQVAGAVPFTPGGAGVQQALLVKVFAKQGSTAVIAAYSVGQQIAIAAFTATVGLGAVIFIFRFRSFKEVISAGRASREEELIAEGRAKPRDAQQPPPEQEPPRPRPYGVRAR